MAQTASPRNMSPCPPTPSPACPRGDAENFPTRTLQLGKLGMGSAVEVLVPHALELQILLIAEQNSLVPIFGLEREFELFSGP
jgi:hypothetical protein